MQKIITRKEARELGLKLYFTGKPCHMGHIDQRRVSVGHCLSCEKERDTSSRVCTWSKRNREKSRNTAAKWRAKNKDKISSYNARWYSKNAEKEKQRHYDWVKRNPEKAREIDKRRRSTPDGIATKSMRDNLRRCLKNKNDRTSEILGYTKDDLVQHIERQFVRGMSWSNHGEWHIDHIVPVSWFVKNGETDPKVINALTNLRPMWASENISKGNKREVLL